MSISISSLADGKMPLENLLLLDNYKTCNHDSVDLVKIANVSRLVITSLLLMAVTVI